MGQRRSGRRRAVPGTRLDAALQWSEAGDAARLNPTEAAFLEASRQARDAEQARLRRTNRRLRSLVAAIGVALVVALVATGDRLRAAGPRPRQRHRRRAPGGRRRPTPAPTPTSCASPPSRRWRRRRTCRSRCCSPSRPGAAPTPRRRTARWSRRWPRTPGCCGPSPGRWLTPSTVLTADGQELHRRPGRRARSSGPTPRRSHPVGEPLRAGSKRVSASRPGPTTPAASCPLDLDGTLVVWDRAGGHELSRRPSRRRATSHTPPVAAGRDRRSDGLRGYGERRAGRAARPVATRRRAGRWSARPRAGLGGQPRRWPAGGRRRDGHDRRRRPRQRRSGHNHRHRPAGRQRRQLVVERRTGHAWPRATAARRGRSAPSSTRRPASTWPARSPRHRRPRCVRRVRSTRTAAPTARSTSATPPPGRCWRRPSRRSSASARWSRSPDGSTLT